MNTNEQPTLADNILWDRLEKLFGAQIILNQEDVEDFLIENKNFEISRPIKGIHNTYYVLNNKAFGKQTIIGDDEIFKPENMRKVIESNHLKLKKGRKNSDVRIFCSSELHFIEEVLKRKCPNGQNTGSNYELSLYFILQDYKEELNKYLIEKTNQVQEEIEPTDSKEPKKQLRQDAFKTIILPILEKFTNINELSKDDKGDLIRLIVGCNAVDGYQNVYTGKEIKYNKDLNESDIKIMNRLKERLKLKER